MNVVVAYDLAPDLVARIAAVSPEIRVRVLGQGTRASFGGRLPYPSELTNAVPPTEIEEAARDAEVIFSGWAGPLPRLHLPAAAPHLRWVQLTHVGFERVDPARIGDVSFVNIGEMSAGPIAEWVIGCMLMFAKGWPGAFHAQREHAWRRYMPREVDGATVGIVGLGSIGGEVARRARALGCRVMGMRRSFATNPSHPLVDTALPPDMLHHLLAESDYVVLTAPLTAQTRGMIDAAALRAMRPEAVLLNVGRGPLIDEPALIEALRSGGIAGAALDVFGQEPLPADSPLWDLENIVMTPHISAGTDRYYERATEIFCANLRRYLAGEPLAHLVDPHATEA
ncbi:MAG: D-2-hydroxyacid dehydrogenase [Chloroflexi bacterium]|nr:D-2-hydroxyacid dehydrogenase [Chloroflexota bacterium]